MKALRIALVRLVPEKRGGAIDQKQVEHVLVALIDEYRQARHSDDGGPLHGTDTR